MRRLILITLCVLIPFSASAINICTDKVIIPIIGRFPGVPPSQWQTDVFLSNPYSVPFTLTLTFHVSGGSVLTASVPMQPYSAVSLPDIVLNTFGLSNAGGQLEIDAPDQMTFQARARIFNRGLAVGEFGQGVPGIGISYLSRQGYVFGLSGLGGNRVNVGVANPGDVAVTGVLRVADKDNNPLAYVTETIQAHETRQFNDIFTTFGIPPQSDVEVEFNTNAPIYFYASEVRNDTGDAVFSFGTSPNG